MAQHDQRASAEIALRARAADLVFVDCPDKVALASNLVAEAQRAGDALAESMATQALGMAWRERGELQRGEVALVRSVALADGAGDRDQSVQARTSLVALYMMRGDIDAAESLGRRIRPVVHGRDAARLDVQLAHVASRAGRLRDALAAFDRSEPVLESAGDSVWLARLRVNRAIVLGHLGRLPAAERDLERAAAVLRSGTSAAMIALNRAWLAALSADVPRALALYDEALAAARAAGAPTGLVLRDRAELLSSVGLWAEACEVAGAAVAELDRANPTEAADTRLVLAEALQGADRPAEAAAVAEAAEALFVAQGRPAWAARARVARSRAGLAAGAPVALADVMDALAALERAGLRTEARRARSLAARLAVASGRPVPVILLPLAPVAGPPWVRAEAWLAEAERREAAGDGAGARRAVLAGLRPLEMLRRMLGSIELRAGVAATALELADLGVALAVDGRAPQDLLAWAERRSAAVLPQGGVRVDDRLAEALATLRAAGQVQAGAGGDGWHLDAAEAAASRAMASAEAAVRSLARRAEVNGATRMAAVSGPGFGRRFRDDLAAASEEWAVVRFVACGGHLGVVVVAGGRISRHASTPSTDVAGSADRLRSCVARMAAGGGVGARARRGAEATACSLDSALLVPLRRRIGDRPLVIVPDGPLESVPWRALPSLAGVPFCVAPSAAGWLLARRRPVATGPAVFVGGPRLPGADAEVRAAAAAWGRPGARLLVGGGATVDTVRAALDGAAHAHFACHGLFRADNPLFSALEVADGPLTVVDLDLLGQAPTVVVLASCDAGLSRSTSGAEVLGMAAGFLATGARTTLASVVPIADAAVAPLAVALTGAIGGGAPPSTALAEVTAPALASEDPSVVAAALGLCCFGAG